MSRNLGLSGDFIVANGCLTYLIDHFDEIQLKAGTKKFRLTELFMIKTR